jgi:1,5-anhydro-D-fructose reductase (1,5-anhydro-D-mannitol-forming)
VADTRGATFAGMTVGVGLVGCGSIGQIHAVGLAQLVEDGEIRAVVAVDPSPEARAAADRNCHFGELSSELEAAVSHPDVQAIVVAGPTVTHPEVVRAVIGSKKAVLCEKPLATGFSEVERLVADVEASGVVAQVGFHSRFNPLFVRLRQLVDSGELGAPLGYVLREDQFWPTGSVVAGHSSWRSDPQQAGGGALLEHTIHGCDLLVHLFGPATSVSARTRSVFGFGVEDIATAQVEHVDGTIGTITTVFNGVVGREERRLEVFFEQATVETTGDFIIGAPEDSMAIHRPGAPAERPDLDKLRRSHFAVAGVQRTDLLFYQYLADRSFVRAVRAGRPASPGFADAWNAHALVDAAYRSASAGGAPAVVAKKPSTT